MPYDGEYFTWEGNSKLMPAGEILRQKAEKGEVYKMPGIPFGLNYPFRRALKAINGEEVYYRWGEGASGAPR